MSEKFRDIPLTTVSTNKERGRICIAGFEQALCLQRLSVFDYAAEVDPQTQGTRASALEDMGLEEIYTSSSDACIWLYAVALRALARIQERILVRTDNTTVTRGLKEVGMTEILGPNVAIRQPCGRITSMPDPSVGSFHSTFVN